MISYFLFLFDFILCYCWTTKVKYSSISIPSIFGIFHRDFLPLLVRMNHLNFLFIENQKLLQYLCLSGPTQFLNIKTSIFVCSLEKVCTEIELTRNESLECFNSRLNNSLAHCKDNYFIVFWISKDSFWIREFMHKLLFEVFCGSLRFTFFYCVPRMVSILFWARKYL